MHRAIAKKLNPAERESEFVVGGGRSFSAAEVFSNNVEDRLQPQCTPEARRLMRYDAEIESSVEFLIDAIFADGIQAVAKPVDEDSEDYAAATEISDFCGKAVQSSARTLEAVLRELFRGAYYAGAKVGEIVLRLEADNRLVLDRINAKPTDAVAFVCDKFYNVLGLVGAKGGGYITSGAGSISKDEIIPREKFIVLQLELEDNDPRGRKKIAAAVDGFLDKRDSRTQWKEWRRTSAIPKKVGITPEGARPKQILKADGLPIIENGIPKVMSAEKELMTALEGFANNSTVTAPAGTEIKQLEVVGTGQQFTSALKFNNSEIRKAILGDSVSTGEDDKGIKAAKQVAMNVVDLRVKSFRNAVADAVERDVFRLLTIVNFGEDKAHLTPRCSLGDTERRDWATDLSAASGAGYQFSDEHLPELDVQFGLRPRTLEQNDLPAIQTTESPAEENGDEAG